MRADALLNPHHPPAGSRYGDQPGLPFTIGCRLRQRFFSLPLIGLSRRTLPQKLLTNLTRHVLNRRPALRALRDFTRISEPIARQFWLTDRTDPAGVIFASSGTRVRVPPHSADAGTAKVDPVPY